MPALPKRKALGKGIGAIIGGDSVDSILQGPENDGSSKVLELDIDSIKANPDQPREYFDPEKLDELAQSIKSMGLIQPIIVQKHGSEYHIIAGERRYRAARIAGLSHIPAIVKQVSELDNISIALIENIQRENLNPIEEAKAYKILLSKFKLKQQELAERLGKDRSSLANTMRLLNLPKEIQDAVVEKQISYGHARSLLSIESEKKQIEALYAVIKNGLSVRQLEKQIKDGLFATGGTESKKKSKKAKDAQIKKLEEELRSYLGTKVEIQNQGEKGKIEIHYYSLDDFDRIHELLTSH